MESEMVVHKGGCHCKNVRWEVYAPRSVVARQCNCSDYSMRANIHFIVPSKSFKLLGDSNEFITTYTFGTHTAKHTFCKVCGITSFYVPRSNPNGVAVTYKCVDRGTLTHVEIKQFDVGDLEGSYKETGIASCSKVSNRTNPCEDRISCLPDEILRYIQSLLDHKKVAQMSILSRRWLNLWKLAPVLQFGAPVILDLHLRAPIVPDGKNQKPECDKLVSTISRVSDGGYQRRKCELFHHWIRDERNYKGKCGRSAFWMTRHGRKRKGECDKIVNWMSRVSQMHKGQNSNELRVSYTLYKCYKKKGIDSWWEDTLAREIQSLELNFSSNDDCQDSSYVFPERFLSFCSDCLFWTLGSDAFDSHFLESSGFKSLKSISSDGILITLETIDIFLLNCPFLERLEVVGSPALVCFKIEYGHQLLALKYLKIEDCENLETINILDLNIVSLKITAPARAWLGLRQLPKLVELSIEGTPCHCRSGSLNHPELETLTLGIRNLKAFIEFTLFALPKPLKNLKRLVINVDASGDETLTRLINIIMACPLLEEFVLMLNWTEPQRSSRMLTELPKRCPNLKSAFKRLKVVEFLGYYGRVSDVELIAHLMVNADNLEEVIVDPWNPRHMEHRYEEEAEARSLALQQLEEHVPFFAELTIR